MEREDDEFLRYKKLFLIHSSLEEKGYK